MDQIIIKIVLIAAFVLLGLALLRPGGSARTQAIRTLVLILFLGAAVAAIAFPAIVNDLATLVGVGRGADLVLYAFIVVFIGNALSTTRKRRVQDQQITELARRIALADPKRPEGE